MHLSPRPAGVRLSIRLGDDLAHEFDFASEAEATTFAQELFCSIVDEAEQAV